MLTAIAVRTRQVRLATGVLISPLRPAVLLAKTLATLDSLAPGRIELGIGTGWQREEYEASGLDFDQRWTMLDDGARAMQLLWRDAPATFSSKTVNFSRIYSTPFPAAKGIPLWYGVQPTERQAQRIAELGVGWIPISTSTEYIRNGVAVIRNAYEKAGRDPATLQVRAHVPMNWDANGRCSLEESIDAIPELLAAGVTVMEFEHHAYVHAPEELEPFYARLIAVRDSA